MQELRPHPDITLIQADFRDVADLLHPADMVLVDPPYGVNYYSKRDGTYNRKRTIQNDTELRLWPVELMAGLLKPDRAMVVFTRDDVQHEWRDEMEAYGLTMKTSVVWDKQQWTAGDYAGDLRRQTEMALVGHKGRVLLRSFELDGKQVNRDTNLWSHAVPRSRNKPRHPTAKPVDLMVRAILNWTDPGDLILDPFMGGSPVGVAALRTGRRYIGIELDEGHFAHAADNINEELLK